MVAAKRAPRAARGFLARLVAVVATVAGLALLAAPQCLDGMANAEPAAAMQVQMPIGSTVGQDGMAMAGHEDFACRHAAALSPASTCGVGVLAFASDAVRPNPAGAGGLLATCLLVLVVVLVAFAVLWPPGYRAAMRLPRALCTRPEPPRPRRMTLAQLCVLRL